MSFLISHSRLESSSRFNQADRAPQRDERGTSEAVAILSVFFSTSALTGGARRYVSSFRRALQGAKLLGCEDVKFVVAKLESRDAMRHE